MRTPFPWRIQTATPHEGTRCHVPVTWPYLCRKTNLIYGLGLPALLSVLGDHAPSIRGISCWAYLGNINWISALVSGDSDPTSPRCSSADFGVSRSCMTSAFGSRWLNPNLAHPAFPLGGSVLPTRIPTAPHSVRQALFHLYRTPLSKYTVRTPRIALRGKQLFVRT